MWGRRSIVIHGLDTVSHKHNDANPPGNGYSPWAAWELYGISWERYAFGRRVTILLNGTVGLNILETRLRNKNRIGKRRNMGFFDERSIGCKRSALVSKYEVL